MPNSRVMSKQQEYQILIKNQTIVDNLNNNHEYYVNVLDLALSPLFLISIV